MSKLFHVTHQAVKEALDCTKQLFTDSNDGISNPSLEGRLVGTMSYMAATAFTAGKTPEEVKGLNKSSDQNELGVKEHTIDGTTVTHVNKNKLSGLLDSVLKIELKSLSNIIDKDSGFSTGIIGSAARGKSDPLVVFSKGVSMSTSELRFDESNVRYNSNHYLFIRKKDKTMVREENDKVKIDIFDVDERWMRQRASMKAIKEKSELLGSKSYDVDSLNKTGRHPLTIEIKNSRWGARPMRLELFYEFLTFDKYCQEQGKSEDSKWLNDTTFDDDSKQMLDVLNIAKLQASDPLLPLLQFDNKNTSTEGWIHICNLQKVLIVGFKGTNPRQPLDIWTDIKGNLVSLEGLDGEHYKLEASDTLSQLDATVHKGFRDAYVSIRDIMLETLYAVSRWRTNWLIVFTGHSLGGALATLAAYEASNRTVNGSRPRVAMINFGCPRLASDKFRERYDNTVPVSYRFCAARDIIPFLPPHLGHVGREVQKDKDGELIVKDLKDDEPDTNAFGQGTNNILWKEAEMLKLLCSNITSHFKPSYFGSISEAAEKLRK